MFHKLRSLLSTCLISNSTIIIFILLFFLQLLSLSQSVEYKVLVRDNVTILPPTPAYPVESENRTVFEPIRCETNEDCFGFSIDLNPGPHNSTNLVICDELLKICIVAIESDNESQNHSTESSFSTTTTTTTTETPEMDDFHRIPMTVWILFTIPFISIIILGVICGRRLRMQSENIQNNLMRTTIHGVHVDQLLSQSDILARIALTRPPPTYEKATGEVPPSYETFLQVQNEKRLSLFQSDMLANNNHLRVKIDDERSYCDTCSSNSCTIHSNIFTLSCNDNSSPSTRL